MNVRRVFAFLVFLLGLSGPAWAGSQDCTIEEAGQIVVSFNDKTDDLHGVNAKLESKVKDIEAVAAKAGITEISVSNDSYNLYPASVEACEAPKSYTLSGSYTFSIKPVSKAPEFMALLAEKKISATLTVNRNKKCGDDEWEARD